MVWFLRLSIDCETRGSHKIWTCIQARRIFEKRDVFQKPHSAFSDAAYTVSRSLISPRHSIGLENAHFALISIAAAFGGKLQILSANIGA
jgi:hypothetical protein